MNTMVSQTGKRTISVHNEHEFLLKMEKAGLTDKLAQKVIDSNGNDLATKMVRLIEDCGFEPSTSQKHARQIMGRNFFGIEEAIKHFGVNPSRVQTVALSEVPFTEQVLSACKDTHILVAVFPLSILDVRAKVKDEPTQHFYDQSWYNNESFAKNRGEIGWQLVSKPPVENSTSKSWDERQQLFGKDEVTASARVCVYTIIGHYMVTGERLFANSYVRCSDINSDGYRVHVGRFDAHGLTLLEVLNLDSLRV